MEDFFNEKAGRNERCESCFPATDIRRNSGYKKIKKYFIGCGRTVRYFHRI